MDNSSTHGSVSVAPPISMNSLGMEAKLLQKELKKQQRKEDKRREKKLRKIKSKSSSFGGTSSNTKSIAAAAAAGSAASTSATTKSTTKATGSTGRPIGRPTKSRSTPISSGLHSQASRFAATTAVIPEGGVASNPFIANDNKHILNDNDYKY